LLHLALIAGAFFLPVSQDVEVDLSVTGEVVLTGKTGFLSGRRICPGVLLERAKEVGAHASVRIWDDNKGYREYAADGTGLRNSGSLCGPFICWGGRSYRIQVVVTRPSDMGTSAKTVSPVRIPRAAIAIDFWIFVYCLALPYFLAVVGYWFLGLWRLGRGRPADTHPDLDGPWRGPQ